jgi:hypothetical protein
MSKDCVQISGGVEYEFRWGDYAGAENLTGPLVFDLGTRTIMDNDGTDPTNLDWRSRLDWWLQFVGIAASDFGNAKVVIKIADDDHEDAVGHNEVVTQDALANSVVLSDAYVAIGDTTQLVAGRRDTSVFLDGDDAPYGFIGLFHSDEVDPGVDVFDGHLDSNNHVIQLYHTLGDSGVTLSAGLEDLYDADGTAAGKLAATIAYAGDTFAGHISGAAGGVLDGVIEDWKMHAAGTATLDNFKVRGAFAAGSIDEGDVVAWNGLVSAEATFDMFTLFGGFEAAYADDSFGAYLPAAGDTLTQWGFNLGASAAVTDAVTIAAAFRWFESDVDHIYYASDSATWHAAAQLIAKLTETLTATGEVGYYDIGDAISLEDPFYGKVALAWAPGGAFTSSIAGEVNSLGAYKATFKAAKTFK